MKKSVKILGIIPARGGSKSIPHKNIIPLSGKPLIHYSIAAAKQSKLLDAFIVSTDDKKIARVAESLGADVPFLRPQKYAQDQSRDIEYLRHAVYWLEKNRGWKPTLLVMLQPTSPARTGEDIDAVITHMTEHGCDSVRTMIEPGPYNPFKMWYLDPASKKYHPLLKITPYKKLGSDVPRQILPKYLLPVGLVYATRAKFIKRGRVWGENICPMVVDADKFVDIDDPRDLAECEERMRKLNFL
jgi:CMP-N-acetylneuraminic acid synthetase